MTRTTSLPHGRWVVEEAGHWMIYDRSGHVLLTTRNPERVLAMLERLLGAEMEDDDA